MIARRAGNDNTSTWPGRPGKGAAFFMHSGRGPPAPCDGGKCRGRVSRQGKIYNGDGRRPGL
ncbi:hypothetical protein AW736_15755 [Termitidicoccus mucosus]|uniref:Uncharacterized protein n=1 Tax=Termitidicoccus mucosus TaxID=1184151 RepID=A0A178II06_9BACT|nr:hypothetical protein AW736_15755 [Opitutaceae bacterium TSB47]